MMRISFISYYYATFVKQDYEILSRLFDVERIDYRTPRDIRNMARSIYDSNIIYSWFAAGHSFMAVLLAKMMKKRSIVVAGGYDVAYEREINYGQYTLAWHKRLYTDFVLKYADVILAVSQFSAKEAKARSSPRKLEIVYLGIDSDRFKPKGEKEDLVMTVASGSSNIIRLKGLGIFANAAKYFPKIRFLIIGLSERDMKELRSQSDSQNLELCGRATHEELIGYYQRAKVYCQLSYRESFGASLAEAMACGCVPVVTDRGALPEVVGDTGFYVPYEDEKATAKGIKSALKSDKGALARKRIEENFSLRKREKALLAVIESL
jgi:glycosyltransferase involved in cell wall biosynthesis